MGALLVAYGLPPNRVHLFSASGADLQKQWKFDAKKFSGSTRLTFERQLRTALSAFLLHETRAIVDADFQFITGAPDLRSMLRAGRYKHLVYYGHAVDDGRTLKPLQTIGAVELQHVLQGSSVDHIDILGCQSTAIAAHLASAIPKLTVGSLRGKRYDDIEVDLRTMRLKKFTIVPQAIFHFGPAAVPK